MKIKGKGVVLDDLDWQILQFLQQNAKMTYAEIGNKLDVSQSTVCDRIRKMEEHEVIKKYEAVVDPEKIGVQQITALVTITANFIPLLPSRLRLFQGCQEFEQRS